MIRLGCIVTALCAGRTSVRLFLWFSIIVCISGCTRAIHITPFNEKEIHELGRVGIEADRYVPKAVPKDGTLTAASRELSRAGGLIGDHIIATGKGAYEGGKKGFLVGATALPCKGDACVLNAALGLTGMTIGIVGGAIKGALEEPELTEAQPENYDALADVQAAIETSGLQATLRDRLWERL